MNAWLLAFCGGILIGLSATILLLVNGRIAGISGIFSGALTNNGDRLWRIAFLVAMILGATLYITLVPAAPQPRNDLSAAWLIPAGMLVGIGTQLGGGCTSGHGVCGLGRLSKRSFVAVIVFMTTAFATAFVMKQILSQVIGVGA